MKKKDKKDAIKMLMRTAKDDLGIEYNEFIEISEELNRDLDPKGEVDLYKEISPNLYRRV